MKLLDFRGSIEKSISLQAFAIRENDVVLSTMWADIHKEGVKTCLSLQSHYTYFT